MIHPKGPSTEQSRALSSALETELIVVAEIQPQPNPEYEDYGEEVEEAGGMRTKTFYGVKDGEVYTISLLTVMNGKVISEVRKTITTGVIELNIER